MMRHPGLHTFLAALLCVSTAHAPVMLCAQDEPPAKPPAKGVARDKAAPGKEPIDLTPADPIDTVLADLDMHKPENLLFALDVYLNLQRHYDAKRILKQFIDAKMPPAALVHLQQEKGSGLFSRLVRTPELQPEGGQFGNLVLNAAYAAAHDKSRLEGLLGQLGDANPEQRALALAELRLGDTTAVQVLVHALSETKDAATRERLKTALALLGTAAVEPLLGALAAPDAALQRDVVEVLGALRKVAAVPFLVRAAVDEKSPADLREAALGALETIVGRRPKRNDAIALLATEVENFFGGQLPGRPDFNGQITQWQWDEKGKTVMPYKLAAADAAKWVAAQLSRDLYALAPQLVSVRRHYLISNLEAEKLLYGLGKPLPRTRGSAFSLAAAAGVEAVEDALAYAMEQGHIPAAMGAAEVLGDMKDARVVASSDGRARPLVQALRHGDRRLRYNAAVAIMAIDPKQAYPGSSHLPDTLAFLAGTSGQRRVLVGYPRAEEAQTLVGLLNDLGFEASAAYTGKHLLQLAINGADAEFILLSDALDHFDDNETLQQLRRDPRTARLPVGIMASVGRLDAARHTAELDPLCAAFLTPIDPKSMAREMRTLVELAGRYAVLRDERLAEAAVALDGLARLAANRQAYGFYDLLPLEGAIVPALYVPELTTRAAALLGELGSPTAQQVLVDVASQDVYPLAQRQAAATAFLAAVKARGLLLTTDEIEQQYDRYNHSAKADAASQKVLGGLLDAIELNYNKKHRKP